MVIYYKTYLLIVNIYNIVEYGKIEIGKRQDL